MAGYTAEINFWNSRLADIHFGAPDSLHASKAVDGIRFRIPAKVQRKGPRAFLMPHLLIEVSFNNMDLGIATEPYPVTDSTELQWSLFMPSAAVRAIERSRDGGPVTLKYQLRGNVHLLATVAAPEFSDFRDGVSVLGPSQNIYQPFDVTYSREAWGAMLHSVGYGENVFVEIPIEPEPTPEWEKVYRALRAARDALDRGGIDANRAAIMAVRDALEEWKAISDPMTQTPVANVPRSDIDARKVEQRVDALRWHLQHYCHEAAHSRDRVRTRREAVLAVSTLAALLAYEVRL